MNTAGFVFTGVKKLAFAGRFFTLTGFCTSEKEAITREIERRGGRVTLRRASSRSSYLVVREDYPVLTKKYLRTVELNGKGRHIGILSDAEFYALLPSAVPALASRLPKFDFDLLFGLWNAEHMDSIHLDRFFMPTVAESYLRFPELWQDTSNGAAGAVVDFMKREDGILLSELKDETAMQYCAWLAENTLPEELCRRHPLYLERFFAHGNDEAVFRVLDRLLAEEEGWEKTGYSDGRYTLSLTDGLLEKAEASGDIERKLRYLTFKHERFPAERYPAADDMILSTGSLSRYPAPAYWRPGSMFVLGRYPQTESGEALPVEWIVLEEKDGIALLISRYALDTLPYNDRCNSPTWETCTLRQWLNRQFFAKAFGPDERAAIPATHVRRDPGRDTEPEYDLLDKVFLLSRAEAGKYADLLKGNVCFETDWAAARCSYPHRKGRATDWWLRSCVQYGSEAAYFGCDCSPSYIPEYTVSVKMSVRPALRVDIQKLRGQK